MKKSNFLLVLVAFVLLGVFLWFGTSAEGTGLKELLPYLVGVVVVGLALFAGYRRITSLHRGEPAEDELSRKIMVKSSSVSFFISIYFWLAIMYFSDKVEMACHSLIGSGIAGMAVIMVLSWLYFKFRGVGNE